MAQPASPSFSVRFAVVQDAAEMARLFAVLEHPTGAAAITARWADWTRAGNRALVAQGSGPSLLGLATLHRTEMLHRPQPVGRITALVVDPEVRGQGVGRALVLACEAEHRRAGCGLLEVTSNLRRVEAHAFYECLGYERTSLRFAKVLAPSH